MDTLGPAKSVHIIKISYFKLGPAAVYIIMYHLRPHGVWIM